MGQSKQEGEESWLVEGMAHAKALHWEESWQRAYRIVSKEEGGQDKAETVEMES